MLTPPPALSRVAQNNYVMHIAGIHPLLNHAPLRLPCDFPTAWGPDECWRINHFVGINGIYCPLLCTTVCQYNELCIRLFMDELAHTTLPLVLFLHQAYPNNPRFPPYKSRIPNGVTPLPYCIPHLMVMHRNTNLHLR